MDGLKANLNVQTTLKLFGTHGVWRMLFTRQLVTEVCFANFILMIDVSTNFSQHIIFKLVNIMFNALCQEGKSKCAG